MRKFLAVLTVLMLAVTVFASCGSIEQPADESYYDLIITEDSSEQAAETSVPDKKSDTSSKAKKAKKSSSKAENSKAEVSSKPQESSSAEYVEYWFRTKKLRDQHFEKHGKDMGFKNADDYRKAASDVVNSPDALHKTEKEDGDDVYYLEDTNEFVVVSTDGYLRTYFNPDGGKAYFDRQ